MHLDLFQCTVLYIPLYDVHVSVVSRCTLYLNKILFTLIPGNACLFMTGMHYYILYHYFAAFPLIYAMIQVFDCTNTREYTNIPS